MNPIKVIKNFFSNVSRSARMSEEIREGIANQSSIINDKLMELIAGLKNQTEVINSKLNILHEIREGVANQSSLINDKLLEIMSGLNIQPQVINSKLGQKTNIFNEGLLQKQKFSEINNGLQAPPVNQCETDPKNFEEVLKNSPLMFAPKTFNTSHPGYNATEVRNFPGKVFNSDKDFGNPVYTDLKKMLYNSAISDSQWNLILKETLEEVKDVPYAHETFERKSYVENYLNELEKKYGAFYRPGWVNLDDALFLYWVVRRLNPQIIVQTGVCNGLSSAFMMLALVKNDNAGTLHVIDLPPVFDSNADEWKSKNKVYGVVIPEGKTSGWLVPDAYKDRLEVLEGDAKLLLPGLLERLGKIDMFYHDSDHTYDHMMFEFSEAKKYLAKHGVIVSDDISWNASLWDFADDYRVPAYNYKGSIGVACF